MTFTVQLLDDTVEPVDSHHAAGLYRGGHTRPRWCPVSVALACYAYVAAEQALRRRRD